MRTRQQATIQDLRLAIECLPRATRIAMLEGIRTQAIIAGAYSSEDGICPMLAAHRGGGRTSCISFARAWDRFAFRTGRRTARRATQRELRVLEAHLEASLLEAPAGPGEFAAAIRDHRRLVAERRPAPAPGDPDRSRELASRPGWAWMRITRRYDEFERSLELVRSADLGAAEDRRQAAEALN